MNGLTGPCIALPSRDRILIDICCPLFGNSSVTGNHKDRLQLNAGRKVNAS